MLKSVGKKGVNFKPGATQAFFQMANIEEFLRGATEYGLPEINLFNSIDLYEGSKGPFLNVINCLHKLGVHVSTSFKGIYSQKAGVQQN